MLSAEVPRGWWSLCHWPKMSLKLLVHARLSCISLLGEYHRHFLLEVLENAWYLHCVQFPKPRAMLGLFLLLNSMKF